MTVEELVKKNKGEKHGVGLRVRKLTQRAVAS